MRAEERKKLNENHFQRRDIKEDENNFAQYTFSLLTLVIKQSWEISRHRSFIFISWEKSRHYEKFCLNPKKYKTKEKKFNSNGSWKREKKGILKLEMTTPKRRSWWKRGESFVCRWLQSDTEKPLLYFQATVKLKMIEKSNYVLTIIWREKLFFFFFKYQLKLRKNLRSFKLNSNI